MAVGDLVDPGAIRDPQLLVRLRARPSEPVSGSAGLTDDAIFTATQLDDPIARPRRFAPFRFIRRLLRKLGIRAGQPQTRLSLLAALNAVTDFQIYGTERGGIEAVAVPFGHVCIVAAAGACDSGRYASNTIRARIEGEFGPFVDPLFGVSASLFEARDFGERQILAFFGRAIFVPPQDEQPVGRVTIERAAPSSATRAAEKMVPRLPDQRPAGLYRGQAGLAFARTDLVAPATSSLLPAGPIAFVLSAPEADEGLDLVTRDMSLPESLEPPGALPVVNRATPAAGEDAAFDVFDMETGDKLLRVAATLDTRPSRLHAEMPGDLGFSIIGVLAPVDNDKRLLDRWWVDLDKRDRLVASAMTWRATTVVCTDDMIEIYDWRERRFDRAQGSRFELVRIATESGERLMLTRSDNEPFGFLAQPPKTMATSFDRRWWRSEGWHLDWMDFSGAVETPGGDSRRLAADTALTQTLPWMPGVGGPAEDLARVTVLDPTQQRFVTGWSGQLEPGATFLVGPLVVSFRAREE